MNARRVVLLVMATVLLLGIVGWHVAVPWIWGLGWMVLGPLLLMVLDRLWGEWQKERLARRLDRFRVGRCTRCGYDLRSSPERCPECGRPRERPEAPLPRFSGTKASARRAEIAEADWLLRLREPPRGNPWRTEAEHQIAGIIVRACREAGGAPNDYFLPQDPLATMIEDWEGFVWFDIVVTLDRKMKIRPQPEEYARLQAMTFEEVVKELAGRVGASAVEPEKPAGRFVSSPGRVGLLPPAEE